MNISTSATTPEAILAARAEASAWITRLHGPNRSPEMEAGFQRWLGERPQNSEEFEALTEIWDLVAGLPARGAPRLQRWEHSQESRELQALRELQGLRQRTPPRIWARAALILLTCGVLATAAYRLWFTPSYATAVGEQRVVQLADGTRVSLNSNSRLLIAYRNAERRVRLVRGEAFFEVGKDPARPFIVVAGEHQVTALGTAFVVRYESNRTAITLVNGKVAVTSPPLLAQRDEEAGQGLDEEEGDGPAKGAIILTPGKRLTLVKSTPPKLDEPRIEAVTAWRRGEVMLDDTRLADAVAEMNRYDKTTIVIDTPAIAGLIVSGLYHTGDSEGFARSVARMYGLEIAASEGRLHLKK